MRMLKILSPVLIYALFSVSCTKDMVKVKKDTSAVPAQPQAVAGPQGTQGLQGIQGLNGTNGLPGAPGEPGSQIYTAAGNPNNLSFTNPKNGDFFVDTLTADYYRRENNIWNVKGSFRLLPQVPRSLIVHLEYDSDTRVASAENAWNVYPFNKKITDDGNYLSSPVSAGVLLLKPGTYHCRSTVPLYLVGYRARSRLVVFKSTGMESFYGIIGSESSNNTVYSSVEASFVLTENTNVRLEYYVRSSNAEGLSGNVDESFPGGPYVYGSLSCQVY